LESGSMARLTGPSLVAMNRWMPVHQGLIVVLRHHEQPADRQVQGQPSSKRRPILALKQCASLSARRSSPPSRSAAITRSCVATISAIWRRVVIADEVGRARCTLRPCQPASRRLALLAAAGLTEPSPSPAQYWSACDPLPLAAR
jgi:hypothetical protein